MKTLTLLDKFYTYGKNLDTQYLSRALIQLVKEKTKEYDVDFEFVGVYGAEKRPIIAFSGKDESFVYNYLINEFGTLYKFEELKVGQILRGRMRSPESVNFGIFLDCGVEEPIKDVLLPVHAIRKQLLGDKKVPKKKFCKAFGFFEEMPVYVKITKISFKEKKIECELAERTLNDIKEWLDDGLELLFSTGMPRKQIKRAIKRTGHYEDYITIDRIGFLETVSVLKHGSHAPGILAHIGPKLSSVRFSMLRPSNVKHLFD